MILSRVIMSYYQLSLVDHEVKKNLQTKVAFFSLKMWFCSSNIFICLSFSLAVSITMTDAKSKLCKTGKDVVWQVRAASHSANSELSHLKTWSYHQCARLSPPGWNIIKAVLRGRKSRRKNKLKTSHGVVSPAGIQDGWGFLPHVSCMSGKASECGGGSRGGGAKLKFRPKEWLMHVHIHSESPVVAAAVWLWSRRANWLSY